MTKKIKLIWWKSLNLGYQLGWPAPTQNPQNLLIFKSSLVSFVKILGLYFKARSDSEKVEL